MLTLGVLFKCSLCKDPISVQPTSQGLPVSGESFSLQCVGSQDPASIMWLKNKQLIPASQRVHFSAGNTTVTFTPVLQTDEGLYQCAVSEGGGLIQSVGYKMQVNCKHQGMFAAMQR